MTIKELRSNAVALVSDPDTGEIIRKDTGEVISDNALSQDKEWRSYTSEEDEARARTGAPTSLAFHVMGLSTMLGRECTDASGARIDPSVQIRMERLMKWNSRSSSNC